MTEEACRELIELCLKNKEQINKDDFEVLKIKISKKHGLKTILKNAQILECTKTSEIDVLKKFFGRKPTRSISGVSIVSVMTSPDLKCPHGVCVFCPKGEGASQSYTGKEPASRRARLNNYDPFKQVANRLSQLRKIGHPVDKIELIVQGGTFCAYASAYQEKFIKKCLEAIVGKEFSSFSKLKIAAETSKLRPIGITIETKPNFCKKKHINKILDLGVTRVELGAQTIYDNILKATHRGHNLKDTIDATKLLKDSGLKVCYHMMPGLPGSTPKKDLKALKEIFDNPDFRPDMLKIYPTLVIKGTGLYEQWKNGKYKPLSSEAAAGIIAKAKEFFPKYVRIMRINRDIPASEISAGVLRTDLRELVKEKMQKTKTKCNCIRCREVGHRLKKEDISPKKIEIRKLEYSASGGKEIYISAEDFEREILIGYLRLRFPSDDFFRPEIDNETSLVRELHIYGQELKIGESPTETAFQHRGFGKKLLTEAEEISKESGYKKLLVLSGIGAKQYYKKLGYDYEGVYLSKVL